MPSVEGPCPQLSAPEVEEVNMETYEFTLVVKGADIQTDEALNALYESGCDDATVGSSGGVQYLDFDREAPSYAEAVSSAIDTVEKAIPGATVARVLPDDFVTLAEIAHRTGRTRESVRLLSIGERGPGDFPPPAARVEQRNRLWRWAEVASWFSTHLDEAPTHASEVAQPALNGLLDLREAIAWVGSSDLAILAERLREASALARRWHLHRLNEEFASKEAQFRAPAA
jgi:hypothetical protein